MDAVTSTLSTPRSYDRIEIPPDLADEIGGFRGAWREVKEVYGHIAPDASILLGGQRKRSRIRIAKSERLAALSAIKRWVEMHHAGIVTPLRPSQWRKRLELAEIDIEQQVKDAGDIEVRLMAKDARVRTTVLRLYGLEDDHVARLANPAYGELPEGLMRMGGVIDDIVDWMVETSPRQQRTLCLANTLAFMGAVLGRRVESETGLRTNLYCVGVAPSGSGKDHSRKCVKRLAEAANAISFLGAEDVTSDAAIATALKRSPSALLQIDEVGHFINAATNPRAAAHAQSIPPMLTRLFSSASQLFIGKQYADEDRKPRVDIQQPNLAIYGTTVPNRLWDGLSENEITDGFLPRVLVFSSRRRPEARSAKPIDPPANAVEWIKSWIGTGESLTNLGALQRWDTAPEVQTIQETDGARAQFTRFARWCDGRIEATEWGGGIDHIMWSRAGEHAHKISLVIACSRSRTNPKICERIAKKSIALVEFLVNQVIAEAGDNVSSSDHGRLSNRVYRIIKDCPGIKLGELSRRTRDIKRRERTEIIADLVDQERVQVNVIKTSGRDALSYRAV